MKIMTKRSLSDRQKGMICIILSAFCFAWMNAFVRLSGDLPFIQKSFFRNLVALLFALAMLLREHGCFLPKKGSLPFLVLRAAAGTLGILCNFYAIDHLALSDASILNKMSPFFAILCSWIFLREKLNWKQGLIVLGAFVGALCVIKPTFANADLFPSLIGLLGGFGAGVAYTMVRRLGQIGENKAYIVFFFSAFSCVVTLPYLLFCYEPMTWKQLLCLVMAGLSAAAERTVGSALWLFVTVGILLAVIVAVLAVGIASVINAPAEAFSQTTDYIRICGIGIICIVMFNAIGGMFRGLGDARTPLALMGVACVVNIAGDFALVGALKMGVAGAALATVAVQGILSTFLVRIPVSYAMSKVSGVTLFQIGFATPLATVFGLILSASCVIYYERKRKKA